MLITKATFHNNVAPIIMTDNSENKICILKYITLGIS